MTTDVRSILTVRRASSDATVGSSFLPRLPTLPRQTGVKVVLSGLVPNNLIEDLDVAFVMVGQLLGIGGGSR